MSLNICRSSWLKCLRRVRLDKTPTFRPTSPTKSPPSAREGGPLTKLFWSRWSAAKFSALRAQVGRQGMKIRYTTCTFQHDFAPFERGGRLRRCRNPHLRRLPHLERSHHSADRQGGQLQHAPAHVRTCQTRQAEQRDPWTSSASLWGSTAICTSQAVRRVCTPPEPRKRCTCALRGAKTPKRLPCSARCQKARCGRTWSSKWAASCSSPETPRGRSRS